jgi:hypothetical protein
LEQIKAQDNSKRESDLVAIDNCIARTPDIRVKILQNVYEMLSESRMMYGIEM